MDDRGEGTGRDEAPSVFVSDSWDSDAHSNRVWVLAGRSIVEAIDYVLDR